MHSWKSILALIVFVYLAMASAISFTVHYLAVNPQPIVEHRGNAGVGKVSSIEPECPQKLSLDASWPDEIRNYSPVQSCEEYAT
jgi:hypothetical protein